MGNNEPCCSSIRDGGKEHSYGCRNHTYRRELKPCPFCGGDAEILPQAQLSSGQRKEWLVRCTGHFCSCNMKVFSNFIRDVRAAWNYRKKVT